MNNNVHKLQASSSSVATPKLGSYLRIVEQATRRPVRFRYPSEGHKAGSILGANSTATKKTCPTVEVVKVSGRVRILVSCVTIDEPPRAHPHKIVGDNCTESGVCVVDCEGRSTISFSNIGIHRVKKSEVKKALKDRELIACDPFQQGFAHRDEPKSINFKVVRLCFQAFVEGSTPELYDVLLDTVVSNPIHNKESDSDLVIEKMSHCSAPANGGRDIILLCNKVKEDVSVRFFEERNGSEVWETFVDLTASNIHRHSAITFTSPPYRDENIINPVMCKIQLVRISDQEVSEARAFQFLPLISDDDLLDRMRKKSNKYPRLDTSNQPPLPPVIQYPQAYLEPGNMLAPVIELRGPSPQLIPSNVTLKSNILSPFNPNQLSEPTSRQASISPSMSATSSRHPSISSSPIPETGGRSEVNANRVIAEWKTSDGTLMQLVPPRDSNELLEVPQASNNFERLLGTSLDQVNTEELRELNAETDPNFPIIPELRLFARADSNNRQRSGSEFPGGTCNLNDL